MPSDRPIIAHPTTWKILEASRNQAATSVLAAGLSSSIPTVRFRCLKSLIARHDESGFRSILLNWGMYDQQDLLLIRSQSQKFVATARHLLQDGTLAEKELALAAISELDLTDSADILLEYVLDHRNPLHQPATACLLAMCRRWGRASRLTGTLSAPLRQLLIKKLHGPVLTNCRIVQLMDAWLSLVHWDDAQQRSLLLDPGNAAYSRMIDRFAATNDPAVLQLLAGYFWRSTTPQSIHSLIIEKNEPQLAIEMAQLVSDDLLENVLDRLRYAPPLASMMQIDLNAFELDAVASRRLTLMLAASRNDFDWTLATSVQISQGGDMESRKLAADILLWCKRPTLEQLVRLLQADSLRPADQQSLTSSVDEILQWLNGPSTILRQAAGLVFADFTLERLFKQIGVWPAQLCRIMAHVVMRTEKNATSILADYLQSPSHKKRLAALQVIEWFQCADIHKDQLLKMMDDPRLEVRVRLIDTLSSLDDGILEELLPRWLQDASTDIADAARRAIRRMDRQKPTSQPS